MAQTPREYRTGADYTRHPKLTFAANGPHQLTPFQYDDDGTTVTTYVAGRVEGHMADWRTGIPTPNGSADICDFQVKGGPMVTIWAGPVMLYNTLQTVWDDHGANVDVWIRRLGDDAPKRIGSNGRQNFEFDVLGSSPEPPQKATGKPTTASGWSTLYREKFDGGASPETCQKIIATAAVDGYSFDEGLLMFVPVAVAAEDVDDLPF